MDCPQCGAYVNANLARHIMDFHLALGQLWRCPVEWCSVWKGTAQECMDHLLVRHNADSSVEIRTLDKYFPPWMVTRIAWNVVLRPGMSVITTDVMLFHQHGGRLVHQYRIYADPLPHMSLRGPVMKKLTRFTNQALAVARLTIIKEQTLRSAGTDSKLDQWGHHAPDPASPTRLCIPFHNLSGL